MEAHIGDRSGGAELRRWVGVFHKFTEDPEALERKGLEFLVAWFGDLSGQAVQFSPEVFVLEPPVKGTYADPGLPCSLDFGGAEAKTGSARAWRVEKRGGCSCVPPCACSFRSVASSGS